MNMTLRQWCPECQSATVTWMDAAGNLRCSGHDPESKEHPGWGVRDWDEDDVRDWDEDES